MGTTVADTLRDGGGAPAPASFELRVLFSPDGERDGGVIALERGRIRLGRAAEQDGDVAFSDPAVSKAHAEIDWSQVRRRYLVADLRSSNGTYLNGAAVEREVLAPGDIVRIGATVLRFAAAEPDAVGWRSPDGSLLVGRSPALLRALELVERAAPAAVNVLVLGETGTGKELLADTVHRASGRRGPMRALNCAAIARELVESELFGHVKGAFSGADAAADGMFRAADGGTLFLDEVGELPGDVQAVLLRALETRSVRPVGGTREHKVDVRIVAATNRDLEADVKAGRFRADLYARLAEWIVPIAPLRDRPEDLRPMWDHFLRTHGGGVALELRGSSFEALALHDWPYNARELLRLVRNLALMKPEGGRVSVEDLPEPIARRVRAPAEDASGSTERLAPAGDTPTPSELRELVARYGGNVKEVAAFLGKDRKQVYRWLERFQIDPEAFRK